MPGGVGYNKNPSEADRIHCVCFVVSALTVSLMDEEILDKFKAIRTEANGRSKTLISINNHDILRPSSYCDLDKSGSDLQSHCRGDFQGVPQQYSL